MSRQISRMPRIKPPERPGPAGGKRDQNRLERTQTLSNAALKLFLLRGLESVTIDEIAAEAGVAKGSFYRYFRDKIDLVDALMAPSVEQMRAAFETCEQALGKAEAGQSLAGAYFTLASDLLAAVAQDPNVVRLYLQECRAPAVGARAVIVALSDEILTRAVRLTEAACERGLLRPLDARVCAHVVVGAVEQLLVRELAGRGTFSVSAAPQELISLILDGIRAR
jgi:AcrR family transcriptional regulator